MLALTDLGGIIGCAEDQLRGTIVPRTDIRHVRLVLDEDLGTPEITKLENTSVRIEQEILRLDIAMADTLRMDICQGTEQLVDVYLDLKNGHRRLHLVEKA